MVILLNFIRKMILPEQTEIEMSYFFKIWNKYKFTKKQNIVFENWLVKIKIKTAGVVYYEIKSRSCGYILT